MALSTPIELLPDPAPTRLPSRRGPVFVGVLTICVAMAGGLASIELRRGGTIAAGWQAIQARMPGLPGLGVIAQSAGAVDAKAVDLDLAHVVLRPTIAPIAADVELRPSLAAEPLAGAVVPASVSEAVKTADTMPDSHPRALCRALNAAGLDSTPWRLDPLSGRWSCASDVVRFGETDASLYAAITGGDADTLSLVRLKLNLLAPSANGAVKRQAAALVERLAGQIGLALPPEARASILSGSAYQLSDGAWRFAVRPQESDPARINIFLRNVSVAFGSGETG